MQAEHTLESQSAADRPFAGPAWMLLAALALSCGLGAYALMDPDEGRNAAIAQEMATNGNFLVPHLNGLPFLDKPFLLFAVVAASMRLFGSSEWAVRLPVLLSTWATLALVVWFSVRLFGRETAWVAGTAFVTALLVESYAHALIFDSMLSFFVTLALIAFYLAVEEDRGPSRDVRSPWWTLLAWAAVAGGVFTKGPVALLLPLMVALPFALWRRRLMAVVHPLGLLLFSALVVPWIVIVERAVPGFLRYALMTETWGRLTTDSMHRTGPIWYFAPILLIGSFPWIVMVAAAGRARVREAIDSGLGARLMFLVLWIVLPLAFFSLSKSKRIGYVLPLVPAVALLAAWSWSAASSRLRCGRLAAAGWLLSSLPLLAVGAGWLPKRALAGTASLVPSTAGVLGAVMLLCGVLAWSVASRPRLAPMVLSLPLVLLPVICAPLVAEIATSRSGKEIAAATALVSTASTAVLGVETYSPSLAFYLRRPILVSTSTGKPLRSNYLLHVYPEVVGTGESGLQPPDQWQKALATCPRPMLFLVASHYEVERSLLESAGLPLLYASEKYALLGPCRPPKPASVRGRERRSRPAGGSTR